MCRTNLWVDVHSMYEIVERDDIAADGRSPQKGAGRWCTQTSALPLIMNKCEVLDVRVEAVVHRLTLKIYLHIADLIPGRTSTLGWMTNNACPNLLLPQVAMNFLT